MSPFFKNKRKRCRTGALLLLAGSVLTGTVTVNELSKIPAGSLIASAQELDIESIEAMQRDNQSGAAAGGDSAEKNQNAETVDGQNVSANSDTLAGYGKDAEDALTGDGQNAEDALAGDGQTAADAAQSESSFTDEKLASVLAQIQASLPSSNGDWSVYVCDLKTGAEGSINDHRMQAASLIKLYIMGAVYENYDALIAQYGQDTIDANLYSMITVSDNDAANALTTYLGSGDSSAGMQVVNNYCLAHGYTTSSMGRLLLHSNEFGDNYTSVENCGKLLKMVYWNGYKKERHGNAETAEEATEVDLQSEQTTENSDSAQNTADDTVAGNAEAAESAADEDSADGVSESTVENTTEISSETDQTHEISENNTETNTEIAADETIKDSSDAVQNTATADDAAALTPHASDMFSLLCAQTRRHKIPAQLPDGVRTASKTGELDDVENDAAILYDTDNDLIIVFMSEHLGDCGAAQSTIASLSRQIYDLYH